MCHQFFPELIVKFGILINILSGELRGLQTRNHWVNVGSDLIQRSECKMRMKQFAPASLRPHIITRRAERSNDHCNRTQCLSVAFLRRWLVNFLATIDAKSVEPDKDLLFRLSRPVGAPCRCRLYGERSADLF